MSRTIEEDDARIAQQLRVLLADEDPEVLRETGEMLDQLGHTVLAHTCGVAEAAAHIVQGEPDVSVVVVHDDDEHALDLIEEIREYAAGPVVVLMHGGGDQFLAQAAERGIDAFARTTSLADVQGAIELAIRRRAETALLAQQVSELEGALERRGVIERAKGILMERHGVDERTAFALLRDQARRSNRRVVDLAGAVADGHALLPRDQES
jgi:AmiR/NasT family two-component response regulator